MATSGMYSGVTGDVGPPLPEKEASVNWTARTVAQTIAVFLFAGLAVWLLNPQRSLEAGWCGRPFATRRPGGTSCAVWWDLHPVVLRLGLGC
ncbi:hypothetical protein HaLaN_04579 [Haematococcus lacustris]|uniref:Uncharacterized protein n=1 Tax=Haematococcus lacustris TaxID=44745 RepID=A0A699YSY0_HAELA|nr:hypothetical protein HaLaN_04579 [Haematococcus lacustris]